MIGVAHPREVDDARRFGSMLREIRSRRGLSQAALGRLAGLSRETISRIERGEIDGVTIRSLRQIGRALRLPAPFSLGWRAPELASLLDEAHAAIVETTIGRLRSEGWEARPEWTFSHFGERGSVDVLGWHPASETLLIVEVKSRIVDLQDLHAGLDRKRRLVPQLVWTDPGWKPRDVGLLLVLPDVSTHRHAIARHPEMFDAALPARQLAVRRWLANPSGELRGIWFVPPPVRRGRGPAAAAN